MRVKKESTVATAKKITPATKKLTRKQMKPVVPVVSPEDQKKLIMAEIAEGKKKMAKIKAEMVEKIKGHFHKLTQLFFNQYPLVNSFGWSQYTDYWDDNDTHPFRIHNDYPLINEADEYEFKENNPTVSDREVRNMFKDLVTFLKMFEDNDYNDMFDGHKDVLVTRKAITAVDNDNSY